MIIRKLLSHSTKLKELGQLKFMIIWWAKVLLKSTKQLAEEDSIRGLNF